MLTSKQSVVPSPHGIQFGWIANCVSNLTLFSSWNTSYGEKVTSMPFLITMTGTVLMGLKRFNASDPNKLLPSNVPEGSFIVRAHTPMSNLFSCLWFNEVDRFTPRDQLSFAYTYQKLRRVNPGKPFHLNMFKDCERRAIAKLFRHRSEEKRNILQAAAE
ncbi:hypothetical protein CK203_091248 [Vitis vinifera]|uniref:TOD1/MUCI70 glycosyltransferase-like domain-containing protein n=1 Tax=Vitis vinifera TaxID=29760 RepID=A0A438EMF9_VITVI|nr:hypothetical protein CK203_091248 [Vitis vinifera]